MLLILGCSIAIISTFVSYVVLARYDWLEPRYWLEAPTFDERKLIAQLCVVVTLLGLSFMVWDYATVISATF